jgi:hypothetical protein
LRADVAKVARSVGLAGNPAWKVSAEFRAVKVDFDRVEIIRLFDVKPHPEGAVGDSKKRARV